MCFSCDRKKEAAEPRSITIVKNACFFFPPFLFLHTIHSTVCASLIAFTCAQWWGAENQYSSCPAKTRFETLYPAAAT